MTVHKFVLRSITADGSDLGKPAMFTHNSQLTETLEGPPEDCQLYFPLTGQH